MPTTHGKKSTSRNFSANSGDQGRNGYFDRAFNSWDMMQVKMHTLWFMAVLQYLILHLEQEEPLQLPTQTNQGAAPVIQNLERTSATAQYGSNKVTVSWAINDTKAPQLSYNIQVLNSSGAVVQTVQKNKT